MTKQAEICIILGRRGSGKSTLTKKLASHEKRLIIFDTLNEYVREGVRITNIIDLIDYIEANKKRNFRVIFSPLELQKNFDYVCRLIYVVGNLTFVVEEVDAFCSPFSTPLAFQKLIRWGRHRNVSIIANTRRPAEMSRLLSSQSSRIISFIQHEPRDIAYLKSFVGEEAEKVKTLPEFHYLDFYGGKSEIKKS